jgi:hypothetical protein
MMAEEEEIAKQGLAEAIYREAAAPTNARPRWSQGTLSTGFTALRSGISTGSGKTQRQIPVFPRARQHP